MLKPLLLASILLLVAPVLFLFGNNTSAATTVQFSENRNPGFAVWENAQSNEWAYTTDLIEGVSTTYTINDDEYRTQEIGVVGITQRKPTEFRDPRTGQMRTIGPNDRLRVVSVEPLGHTAFSSRDIQFTESSRNLHIRIEDVMLHGRGLQMIVGNPENRGKVVTENRYFENWILSMRINWEVELYEPDPDPDPPPGNGGGGSGNINAVATGPDQVERGRTYSLDGNQSTSSGRITEWKWYRVTSNGSRQELSTAQYRGINSPDLTRTHNDSQTGDLIYLLEIRDSNGRTDTDTHVVSIVPRVEHYVRASIQFEEEALPDVVPITQEQYENDEEVTIRLWVTAEHSQYSRGSRAPMWFFSDVELEDINDLTPALREEPDHPGFQEYRQPPLDGLNPNWDDAAKIMTFTFRPKSDPYVRAGLIVRSSVVNDRLYDHAVAVWKVPLPSFPSFRVDPPEQTIQMGQEADYAAMYSPPDYDWEMDVHDLAEWTVEDESIAEHIGDGKFIGLRPGTTTIHATYDDDFDEVYGLTDTAILNVEIGEAKAIIEGPEQAYMHEQVTLTGESSYGNGDIVEYKWLIDGEEEREGVDIDLQYPKEGIHEIQLTVKDEFDVTDTTTHTLEILPNYPIADIDVRGSLKENRRVILDASGSIGAEATGDLDIDHTKTEWEIIPLDSQAADGIFHKQAIEGTNEVLHALFRTEGRYLVRNRVENEMGDKSLEWAEKIITIDPDLPPEADIAVPEVTYRNVLMDNQAVVEIRDNSTSPDNDYIASRKWSYRFDSNNNGSFDSEWIRLNDFDDTEEFSLYLDHVGRYQVKLEIIEGFGQPTIPEFITEEHFRRNETTKIFTIDNRAPIVEWGF